MATLISRDLNGLKEGWDETIHLISSTKVPFTTMTGEEKVRVNNPNWLEDEYAAVDLTNARPEGADPTEANGADVIVRTTSLQHMDETVKVSDIADIVEKAGRKVELTRRVFKKVAELKRTREAIMLSGQVADGTTSTPRMGSYQSQLDASGRIATGSATTDPTEALIVETLQTLYENGAEPSVIMVSPDFSVGLTEFSKAAGRHREIPNVGAGSKAVVNAVELFVSPFGEQKVVINRFSLATDTFIFDPSDWNKLCMVPWTTQELGKSGRNTKVQVYGTYGLKHKNYKASAVIRKVTGTNGKF
ncbi:DUF5309 family protein [Methylobacterium sp. Leaf466]|uniref:SU10 major capsid protein n=1 Tax=Methylobacterium sp. Leaf466 TaxID=1736386 RepID=UPI000701E1CC|nr:DUF5309 family protein [Methylobacterium sp. Leaf466]KQT82431.1 hypothetical protein ASG59_18740 [Methylobacterium sp. Leaf466]